MLSELDEKWCRYSTEFIGRMAKSDQPWLLYHCTRGAHFDNYPNERFLGKSPARHPYKDTLLELDEVMGRLIETLRATGQLEDTLIFVTSDNGPHMETWPDSAFTPFRCAKGSTWEGGVRVPGLLMWPGMIEAGRQSDGLFDFNDLLPTVLALAGETPRLPTDRFIDGVDQSSFLLAPDGLSNRKYHYYWLTKHVLGAALRRVQDAAVGDERRRCGLGGTWRFHRRAAALRLRAALQSLSRSEGDPQLHDAQARLHRGVPARHARTSGNLQALSAEEGDGPEGGRSEADVDCPSAIFAVRAIARKAAAE